MKKSLFIPILLLCLLFTGCARTSPVINTKNTDRVSIFYGTSSYAMWSENETDIMALQDCFNGLSFETTNAQMDIYTMLSIYFFKGQTQLTEIHVDQNGTFWLNGDTSCFCIRSGSFDYNRVKEIYEQSK